MARSRPKLKRDFPLPRVFTTGAAREPDAAEPWRRYLADRGDADAFQRLCIHYAPIALIAALQIWRARREQFFEPFEELVSDAMFGIIRAITSAKGYHPATGRRRLYDEARRAIRREKLARSWAPRRVVERKGTIERVRAEFIAEHYRPPSHAELTERLAGLITNPAVQIGDLAVMIPASQTSGAARALGSLREREDAPPRRAQDRELMELAKRKLCAEDRKILLWVLQGFSDLGIARRLNIHHSTATKRVRGILWELRARADLAAYLGVEPATEVPRTHDRPLPISSVPPARRIA
jgi:DNA-directed RNA polymerase specialized sigma subunit